MSELQEKLKVLPSHTSVLPDINTMKKAILAEIGGVTEEDLNVMSSQEIQEFYKQLANSIVEQNKKANQTQDKNEVDIQLNKKNHELQQPLKSTNQQKSGKQTQVAEQKTININGSLYYKPKFIEENTYIMANKKLVITFGPQHKNIQDKRKALCDTYTSSMSQVIKSMKSQQIEDTYERMRLPQSRKHLFLKAQFDMVQFCVYIQPQKLDENLTFLDQQNLPIQNQNKDDQPKRNRLRKVNQSANFIPQDNIIDQFFDQVPKFRTDDAIPQEQNKQLKKKEIKNQSSKSPSTLKQTIQLAKKKQKIETSAQTQKTKNGNNKKTKTQITIISQVEYEQDPEEQEQKLDLRPGIRPRPIDLDIEIDKEYGNLPQKLNLEQFKRALEEPGQAPQQQVLLWIQKMKHLVNELEDNYLNQFRNNWTVIND